MAITANDVTTALKSIIEPPILENTSSTIILFQNEKEIGSVDVDGFVSLFGTAESMTSAALHVVDDGKLGYATYFDEWKAKAFIL